MARPQEYDANDALRGAMRLFWEKGFEATSLADLLQATGLSKSSLYAAFGSKHELFLTAFDAYRAERKRDMDQMLATGSAREGIEGFFRMIVDDMRDPAKGSGCMSINQAVELAPRDPAVQKRVEEDFGLIEDQLAIAVERGQSDGSVMRGRPARDLALLLVLGFPGLQIMVRAGLPQERTERALGQLMSLLD